MYSRLHRYIQTSRLYSPYEIRGKNNFKPDTAREKICTTIYNCLINK